MPSRFIQSMIARRSSSTDRSMPLRADRAWRRNWITDTPGISWGYWKARNSPLMARSSVGQAVMSSPLNQMRPPVTSYSGLPSRAVARVDLPEPLGPMMACTSPGATARSTPSRISSPPSAGRARRPSMRNSSLTGPVYLHYRRRGNLRSVGPLSRGYRAKAAQRSVVAEVFLPRAEAGVAGAGGTGALAGAVGEQPERRRRLEVVGRRRPVARVGAGGGPGSPQQPPPDAALVGGDRAAGQVGAEGEQRRRRLPPRRRRDVAVAGGGGGQVAGGDRCGVERALVGRE